MAASPSPKKLVTGGARAIAGRAITALAAAAAAMLALGAATVSAAPTATTFMVPAKGGQLQGGRLVLRGVPRNLTWASHSQPSRSGAVSTSTLHHRLFGPVFPRGWRESNRLGTATGALHIAGRSSATGLKLSRGRYNRSRRAVSYRVARLSRSRRSGVPRRFGSASLSIVAVGSPLDRYRCSTTVINSTQYTLQNAGASDWDTDSWNPAIPSGQVLFPGNESVYATDGGIFRGCGNNSDWTVKDGPYAGTNVHFDTTVNYNGPTPPGSYQGTCSTNNSGIACDYDQGSTNDWYIVCAPTPQQCPGGPAARAAGQAEGRRPGG